MRVRVIVFLSLATVGCKPSDGYERDATSPWMTSQTATTGNCAFVLDNAYLAHEYDWSGGAKVTVTNEGDAETRCAWELMIVSGAGKALGSRKGWSGSLGAGNSNSSYVDVGTSYTNEGEAEGTWLYVGTNEGWDPTAEDGWHIVDPAREPAY